MKIGLTHVQLETILNGDQELVISGTDDQELAVIRLAPDEQRTETWYAWVLTCGDEYADEHAPLYRKPGFDPNTCEKTADIQVWRWKRCPTLDRTVIL